MNKRLLLIIVTILGVGGIFQNCSKVGFSDSSGTLTKVAGDSGTNAQGLPVVPDPENDGEGTDSDDVEAPGGDEDVADDNSGAGNYICILGGPGNSVRVGYVSDGLVEHGRTPQVVCMSRNACLNIISRSFSVKGPERRGFCPNRNPHVIPMSDAQIEDSL